MLRADAAGTLSGIIRLSYDGTELPVTPEDVQTAQITTRDIDRGAYPHFLLKEVVEAPGSWRKTLRGHIVEAPGWVALCVARRRDDPERRSPTGCGAGPSSGSS